MREFTVDVTKQLVKGLAPFPGNELQALGLDECFNQIPEEVGLRPWGTKRPIGWQSGYFNYLLIADQVGNEWYWYPVFDGHILVGTVVPTEPTTGLDAIPVHDEVVQWVVIPDEVGNEWKLYPDPTTGFTRCTDSTPLSGVAIQNLVWRGTTTESWTIVFNSVEHTRHAVKV